MMTFFDVKIAASILFSRNIFSADCAYCRFWVYWQARSRLALMWAGFGSAVRMGYVLMSVDWVAEWVDWVHLKAQHDVGYVLTD